MKKIIFASAILLGTFSLGACDNNSEVTEEEVNDDKVVVDRDSVPTEYEVTETVVEYDTTTRTKTVDADIDEDID
ncbi:hypothetical protein ACSX1A_05045 [Pontibacter sp. MBLB2868]|uniref:hypothetical protein n=1 Tax=Pontibacter sp. MBLB2868 TaxID=3451555 RepID=UPI003F756307